MSILTLGKRLFNNRVVALNKTFVGKVDVKLSKKSHQYLKSLVEFELDKFEEVSKVTKDPEIKEEKKILQDLNRQLAV